MTEMRQHLSMQFEKLNGRMEQMERNLKRRNSAFSTGTNAPGLSNSGRKLQAEGDLATFRAKGRRVQNGQESGMQGKRSHICDERRNSQCLCQIGHLIAYIFTDILL